MNGIKIRRNRITFEYAKIDETTTNYFYYCHLNASGGNEYIHISRPYVFDINDVSTSIQSFTYYSLICTYVNDERSE